MCTGSGCIPISLKLRNPQIVIEGADISEEALKVAEKNAKKLGVSGKWIQTDMFENITGTFDMITSNPPYIPTKVIKSWKQRYVFMTRMRHWTEKRTVFIFTGSWQKRFRNI